MARGQFEPEDLRVRHITLRRQRIATQVMVDAQYVGRMAEFEDEVDNVVTERLVRHMRSEVLAQTLEPVTREKSVDVWSSWWDHFKSEQVNATSPLWRWVARRWPARSEKLTVSVTVGAEAFYPNANFAPERLGPPYITFVVMS
jgi:hypothetical protein